MPVPLRAAVSSPSSASEGGAALLLALLAVTAVAGLGLALAAVATLERTSAADDARAVAVVYAAEAGVHLALDELAQLPDWTQVPAGVFQSVRHDTNPRPTTDWRTLLDVPLETSVLQRQTDAAEDLGADATRWQVYLATALAAQVPDGHARVWPYVLVWVGDDRADGDGQPMRDTNATLRVRARAFGAGDMRRDVEAVVRRVASGVVQVLSWHQAR